MNRGSELTFFQRSYADGQQIHEKALNITNQQKNQSYNEMSPHTIMMAIIKQTKQKTRKKMWKNWNPRVLLMGM